MNFMKDLCEVKNVMATVVQIEAKLRSETGLNLNQAFALCCLAKGALTAGALAEELRIHGASLSRVIKTLWARGLIHRDIHREDSRQKVLSLTEEGLRAALGLEGCEARIFPVEINGRGLAEKQ